MIDNIYKFTFVSKIQIQKLLTQHYSGTHKEPTQRANERVTVVLHGTGYMVWWVAMHYVQLFCYSYVLV